jgi:hypothetical protein
VSKPTLSRGNFSIVVTVTTDSGSFTTQPFLISYTG